jgi:CRP-like cAMP-binding protein/predicted acylesterase/phospholipase RssA
MMSDVDRADLASIEFLASLGVPALDELARSARRLHAPSGELVVREGDPAGTVLALAQGRLQVLSETGTVLTVLEPGALVGEVTLLVGGRRTATVRTLEDASLFEIDAAALRAVLDRSPERLRELSLRARRGLRRSQFARRLAELLGEPDSAALREIEREVEWITLRGGETLFRAGDSGGGAYLLLSGRLRVALPDPAGERVLGELAPGETVGELGLISGEPRSASVTAIRDSEVAKLTDAAFRGILVRHPSALRQVGRYVVERLRAQPDRSLAAGIRSLALLPGEGIPEPDALAHELAAAFRALGSVRLLSSTSVDAELARSGIAQAAADDPADTRLSQWLGELEATHDFVLYQADSEPSPWRARCLRQADHVLAVADASRLPARAALRDGGDAAERSLLLLRSGEAAAPGTTARWLDALELPRAWQAGARRSEDLSRLARILAGRAAGLVLTGGGTRGFALLGVLRALEELGVPIDLVGGTSMGAVIGAGVARGLRASEVLDTCRRFYAPIFDPMRPSAALLGGPRLREALEADFGELDIEDLPLPYFCVSTHPAPEPDVVRDRGRLRHAVHASLSLPGVLAPPGEERELLLDEGILNHVPAAEMARRARGGRVIAADASLIGSRGPLAAETFYLRLPVSTFDPGELRSIEAIAERGYRAAIGPLRAWWSPAQEPG